MGKLKEISATAGLHRGTVARILNGTYNGRQETKERVLRIARELDYAPNIFARGINRKPLPIVGVRAGHDPYCTPYLRGLDIMFRKFQLAMMTTYESKGYRTLFEQFNPTALVLFGPRVDPELKNLFRRSDVVVINGEFGDQEQVECYRVTSDFEDGFYRLGRWLLELGHRRFLHVTAEEDSPFDIMRARGRGLRRAVGESGNPEARIEAWRPGSDRREELAQRVDPAAGADRPTALVCDTDLLALDCVLGLSARGIRIPQDVSVTGCDGILRERDRPVLATLSVRHHKIAWAVAEWIAGEIKPARERGEPARPKSRVFPLDLTEGETCGPAPQG